MRGLPVSPRVRRRLIRLMCPFLIFYSMIVGLDFVLADNRVYVDVVKSGSSKPVDTLYSGCNYEFRVWIENDAPLLSLRVALRNQAALMAKMMPEEPEGAFWSWENVGGYGPSGIGTGLACITVVPGCRMDPPGYVWDVGAGFRVWEYNTDGLSPDTIAFGGAAAYHGLPAGHLEHMVSIHFQAGPASLATAAMWLDSVSIIPGGGVIFLDINGMPKTPAFSTALTWMVKAVCGDANGDGQVNVADAVFLISYVFRSGSPPRLLAGADVNRDGDVNVGDAVYLINYVFRGGSSPDCGQP